jgi:hypothetical protein
MLHGSTLQRFTLQHACGFQLALAAGFVLMDAANQLEADL